MTIVGTRPEIIKLSRVMAELNQTVDHVLVHTGQNYDYELNEVFFKDLELPSPKHVLNVVGNTLMETIGSILVKTDQIMESEKPDAVLLYGDTNSCLAVMAAKRRKIPVFHMEAGNRSFDQRVPEELNRKVVDHLSDINMTLTEHARRYLLDEGINPETIIKTGSSMKEVIEFYKPKIERSDVVQRLSLKEKEYFLISAHREENVDRPERLKELIKTLEALPKDYPGKKIIFSTHPRTLKRLEDAGIQLNTGHIQFMKPLSFSDYMKLQLNAFCVISDSGTIFEESSLLGFPAVTPRDAHERPEGMDEGTLIMCPIESGQLSNAIKIVTDQSSRGIRTREIQDFNVDHLSIKVVRIINSYIHYINRTVWSKTL